MSAKRQSASGFTIIEVMIVLAIAGIIMLLVFKAIPTLERNGRNNQRKQDVSAILEAVSHYQLNNSGTFPPDCGTDCYGAGKLLDGAKLTFYNDPAQPQVVVLHELASVTAPAANNPNTNAEVVYIYNHQLCKPDNLTATSAGAAYSDVVALYAVETATGSTGYCQQL